MENEKFNNIDKRVEEYRDVDGLSSKKLNFGLWFVERIALFKKILIAILIVISSITWVYGIYGFSYYFFYGIEEDEQIAKSIASLDIIGHEFLVNNSPDSISISKVNSFNINGLYDFYIEMKNNDKNFMAKYNYCFIGDANEIECGENFIYPNERKYIMALGKKLEKSPKNFKFFISNIRWQRVNLHKISNWEDYYFEHTDITIKNVEFNPAYLSGLSEKLNLNVLKFTANNKTPYNYWVINFNILLYSGSNIVAVNKYAHNEFMSEEKIDINLSWPGSLGKISKVEIVPEIDIMDENSYIKYEGGKGEIK